MGEHRANDQQTITVSNRLSGTKSVLWHKQWKDTYNYENGLRPDIYLDIYQVTHVRDNQGKPTTQVSLYQANYHWTYLKDDVRERRSAAQPHLPLACCILQPAQV